MGQRKFSDLSKIAELNKTDILVIERTDGTKQVSFKQLCNAIAVQEITELIKDFPEIEEEDTLSIIGGKINKWHKDALKKIEGLSEDILDSKEEIEANTESGKVAGAQAVKEIFGEINSNLSDFFKIDKIEITTDPIGAMGYLVFGAEFDVPSIV